MVIQRGEIWWADLPEPTGSEPGYRRPVLVVQSNDFNRSRIATAIVVVITSNLKLTGAPGNVFLQYRITCYEISWARDLPSVAPIWKVEDQTVLRNGYAV